MRSRCCRRTAICACAAVLSSYFVVFVVVVSKRVDRSAENRLRKSIVAEDRRARIHRRIQVCALAGFRQPPGPVIALASFPGSGNTWIRFLVQQATGILTGSVYRDYSLKRNGFPGEGTCSGAVVLVKTHEWGPKARARFERAVLLVREPYGALLAEFNRRAAGHIGHAAYKKFYAGNSWRNFVQTQSKLWAESVLDWLEFGGPLLILRYELLAAELPTQLLRLLEFLGYAPGRGLLTRSRIRCVLRNRDGLFRRPKHPLPFDPFDEETRRTVSTYKTLVEEAIAKYEMNVTASALEANTTQMIMKDGENAS